MDEICKLEDTETLISHIRVVLEIFILYSIETSDLKWISDSRVIHFSRKIETLFKEEFQDFKLWSAFYQFKPSMKNYLQISDHMKSRSRIDQCRVEII